MSRVSLTRPFEQCPQYTLAQSETTDRNSNVVYSAAALKGQMLYDDTQLRAACPTPKTQDQCLEEGRAQALWTALSQQTELVRGTCGSWDVLTQSLDLCTPALKELTETRLAQKNLSANEDALARTLTNSCQF